MSQEKPFDLTLVEMDSLKQEFADTSEAPNEPLSKARRSKFTVALENTFEELFWVLKIAQECAESVSVTGATRARDAQLAILQRRHGHYAEQIRAFEATQNASPGDIKLLTRLQRRFEKIEKSIEQYKRNSKPRKSKDGTPRARKRSANKVSMELVQAEA